MILWLMFLFVMNCIGAFVNFQHYKRNQNTIHAVLAGLSSACIGGLIVAIAVLLK